MPLNLRPHEQDKRPKDGRAAQMKVKPYIRLTNGLDVPPIFIQDGMYFTEGGPEVEDLPDWVAGAMAKLSDEARASVGFDKKPKVEVKKPETKKLEAVDKDVELKVEFKVDPKAEVKEPKVEVTKEPSADASKQRKGT